MIRLRKNMRQECCVFYNREEENGGKEVCRGKETAIAAPKNAASVLPHPAVSVWKAE